MTFIGFVNPNNFQVINMQSSSLTKQSYPDSALSKLDLQRLTEAILGLTRQQISWASGYLAGLSQAELPLQNETDTSLATILYATHTGNGQGIAETLAEEAKQQGINVRVLSIADYKPRDLTKENFLTLVISTHGEGEPPESAAEFHRYLFSSRAPNLEHLSFSVFALGDSSYEHFCEAGKQIDKRLETLGAKRLLTRIDADVDFQEMATNWRSEVIEQARQVNPEHKMNVIDLPSESALPRIDRLNPYQATLLENRRLTTDQSTANIHHLVLEIDPRRIRYQPGDALGVWSKNHPTLVNEILKTTQLEKDTSVTIDGQSMTLLQALLEKMELTLLHPTVVSKWAPLSGSESLLSIAKDARKLREFAQDRDFLDLIKAFPAKICAESLVNVLHSLQPRLYSIASSQLVSDDEIHLTISELSYTTQGRKHLGTASNYLAERVQVEDLISVYVAENTQFRLPENGDTDIILIGAGTGIAPYRAFLQQREAEGARGKNWLVFGNRQFREDFLYQQDWINFRKTGFLERTSLAFSRDSLTRTYVQDKLREDGEILYQWLERGARIYVCGSIKMEKAVHQSIAEIITQYGAEKDQDAETYIANLRSQNRYLKDVY